MTMGHRTEAKAAADRRQPRAKQAKSTRDAILVAAEKVFAKFGFAGARVETISKAAKCYDSLIYYYFGSKEKLFAQVLENAYRKMIEAEQALHLDLDNPVEALTAMVQFPWRYYLDHPELITLLGTENLQKAKHLKAWGGANQFFSPAVGVLEGVLRSGVEKGLFRADLDTVDIYTAIMSLGYFYVSNRHTLSQFFGKDLLDAAEIDHWGEFITRFVLAAVRHPDPEVQVNSGAWRRASAASSSCDAPEFMHNRTPQVGGICRSFAIGSKTVASATRKMERKLYEQ
jgi:AcrR family transcriptional regulator